MWKIFKDSYTLISRYKSGPNYHLFLKSVKFVQQKCIATDSIKHIINVTPLSHRSIVKLSGEDCYEFLQGLVTNDLEQLPTLKCMYAMMLNNKGRILHDIILYKLSEDNTVLLECHSESADVLVKSLRMYKLRKRVEISQTDNINVWQVLANQKLHYSSDVTVHILHETLSPNLFKDSTDPLRSDSIIAMFPDPRLSWLGWRVLSRSDQLCSEEFIKDSLFYHQCRHFYGIPEGPNDLLPGKSLPFECNVDFMNGINFDKGCYVGQELTARSHFTGVIRKRLVPIVLSFSTKSIPDEGSLFDAKGKVAGKFRSTVDQRFGLALINLNRQQVSLVSANGIKVAINKTYWWPNLK